MSGEPINIKYYNVELYSTYQRHSTLTMYQDVEENNEYEVRPPSHKHRVHKEKNTIFKLATGREWICSQATKAQA